MYFFEIYVKKCVKLGEKRRVHKKKWSAGKHFDALFVYILAILSVNSHFHVLGC
jgi:hypothetical protein